MALRRSRREKVSHPSAKYRSNILDFAKDPTTGELLWMLASLAEQEEETEGAERFRLCTPSEWTVFDKDGCLLDSGLK